MTKAPTPVKSSEKEKKKEDDRRQVVLSQQKKAKKEQADDSRQYQENLDSRAAEDQKKKKLKDDELKKLVESANELLIKIESKSNLHIEAYDKFSKNPEFNDEFKILANTIMFNFRLLLLTSKPKLIQELREEILNPSKMNPEKIKSLMKALEKLEQHWVHIEAFLKEPSWDKYNKIPADFKPTDAPSPPETIPSTDILRPAPKPNKRKPDDDEPNAAQKKPKL
jgi:methionine synthase II (cobalamin-independent)